MSFTNTHLPEGRSQTKAIYITVNKLSNCPTQTSAIIQTNIGCQIHRNPRRQTTQGYSIN